MSVVVCFVVSLRLFCSCVLFAFVVLGLVCSVLRQEIDWEERLQNDPFLCPVGRKALTQSMADFIFPPKPSFKLRFRPNFGLKPN